MFLFQYKVGDLALRRVKCTQFNGNIGNFSKNKTKT